MELSDFGEIIMPLAKTIKYVVFPQGSIVTDSDGRGCLTETAGGRRKIIGLCWRKDSLILYGSIRCEHEMKVIASLFGYSRKEGNESLKKWRMRVTYDGMTTKRFDDGMLRLSGEWDLLRVTGFRRLSR